MSKELLMDTHIWLWYATSASRLGRGARQAIDDATETGALRVSIMSIWEISLLESAGRLHFGIAIEEWLEKALALPGLVLLPLAIPLILDAHRLPGAFHKDPVDRLLVATARHHEAVLITEDRQILNYASLGYVRARSSSAEE